jgi:hypothetical protein
MGMRIQEDAGSRKPTVNSIGEWREKPPLHAKPKRILRFVVLGGELALEALVLTGEVFDKIYLGGCVEAKLRVAYTIATSVGSASGR